VVTVKETSTTTEKTIYQPFVKKGQHQKECQQIEWQRISMENEAQVVEEDTMQVWKVRL